MKRLWGCAVALLVLAPALLAQEHYTEGPVWRVDLVRVEPTHLNEYLASLQHASKPFLDEEKREGLILDYKVFLKETKSDRKDWEVCLAVEYKDHAALDGLVAKENAIRDKISGGKQQAQEIGEKRQEYRELVSSELLQEIILK
jgi:hypothetical protein